MGTCDFFNNQPGYAIVKCVSYFPSSCLLGAGDPVVGGQDD